MSKSTPKRRRSAWFAFYPDDFSGGTRSMSLAGRGAFIELLSHQFSTGSIPPDDRTICRIIGAFPDEWDAVKVEVLAKFDTDDDGNFVNHRMQKEREEREEIRSKRVDAISKRWSKTDTNVSDLNKQNGYKSIDSVYTSSSSSSSSSLTPSKKNSESKDSSSSCAKTQKDSTKARTSDREEFDAFFREIGLYPRDAESTWNGWEGNGWTNNGKKIVCWKSTVRRWKANGYMPSDKTPRDNEPNWPSERQKLDYIREPEEEDLIGKFYAACEAEVRAAAGDHPDYDDEPAEIETEEDQCF
jgi:uncharacterized protein YdaU (DUF1376 family)